MRQTTKGTRVELNAHQWPNFALEGTPRHKAGGAPLSLDVGHREVHRFNGIGTIDNVYPCGYSLPMIEIRKTDTFAHWLDTLPDLQARARVQVRIARLAAGYPGDVEPVGEGVSELRINYGPGYRVYFKKQGRELIILLAGGDKSTQAKDIKAALRLARYLTE